MRNLHKLLLLAAAAIAAMAMAAPTAGASAGVEVIDEVSEEHCDEVIVTGHDVSGGCELSATSEGGVTTPSITLLTHTSPTAETVSSICSNQFDAHVNEEGHGYITNQVLAGDQCGLTACDEAAAAQNPHDQLPWEIQLGEFFADHAALGATFCVRPVVLGEGQNVLPPCSVVIDVSEPAPHEYEFTANEVPCLENPAVELIGHWTLNETSVEINHL